MKQAATLFLRRVVIVMFSHVGAPWTRGILIWTALQVGFCDLPDASTRLADASGGSSLPSAAVYRFRRSSLSPRAVVEAADI